MAIVSLPNPIKRRIVSLSKARITDDAGSRPEEEYNRQKQSLKLRYQQLTGLEKLLTCALAVSCVLVFVQFIWIASLQYQVSLLKEQTRIEETRLTQLEQASQKHNNLLYSTYETMEDLTKKWHDLHFRVLENTWKLGN